MNEGSEECGVPVVPEEVIVDPSAAYQSVSMLPDEMIKYELETQGQLSANTFILRRKQLADLIKEKKYEGGRQPVAMGVAEDISICQGYVKLWSKLWRKTSATTNCYLIKVKFLDRRVDAIRILEDLEDLEPELILLKKDVELLLSHLQMADITSNWIKLRKSQVRRSLPDLHDHSLLDASLDFFQTNDQRNSRVRGTIPAINSTYRPTFSRPSSFRTPFSHGTQSSSPYQKPKVQILKWNIKFYGEPNTMSVVEFIFQVRELAKSSGTLVNAYIIRCNIYVTKI